MEYTLLSGEMPHYYETEYSTGVKYANLVLPGVFCDQIFIMEDPSLGTVTVTVSNNDADDYVEDGIVGKDMPKFEFGLKIDLNHKFHVSRAELGRGILSIKLVPLKTVEIEIR